MHKIRYKLLPAFVLCAIFFIACNKTPQNIPHYTVSKISRTDSATTLNVHIKTRLTTADLLLIAGKLKADSTQITNLAIHYLLPGNTDISAGEKSYYASAKYVKEDDVKAVDSLKDFNGNVFRIKVFGLSQDKAWKLLTQQPKEITGKTILGRFVDDYSHTVIIPFHDPSDKTGDLYVIEVDSTAKVVSATVPHKIVDGGVEKWLVTQNGDYITLKDSVIAQFAADGLGIPFNSIKSGI